MSTEEGIRKTKVQLELKLVRDVKGKRKDLHDYTGSKSKTKKMRAWCLMGEET